MTLDNRSELFNLVIDQFLFVADQLVHSPAGGERLLAALIEDLMAEVREFAQ